MKGKGNQSFVRLAAKAAGYASGSRCPLPAVSSHWLNRFEVLVGIVKAGRMAWRNSLAKKYNQEAVIIRSFSDATAFNPTAFVARCKV